MRAQHISSRAARLWYLLVGIRWQRWQSAVCGLYFRRVRQPLQVWHAFGCPAAWCPRLPWWHSFVWRYLALTGWARYFPRPRRGRPD